MDRFEAMRTFVAVVDANGFAPAARRIGLSASAATRMVAALEIHLGVRLLNRTTRAVSLTDAGQRFLERARRILADLDEAEQMAESERAEPSGRLVVSAPLIFGRLHLAPVLAAFMTAHPKVQAELILSDRMVNLVEDGVDVALRIGRLDASGDIARRVGATRRVLVASPRYLAKAGTPREPEELARHRLISFTVLSPAGRWRFWRETEELDIAVTPHFVTNSADAAIGHAARDGGLTLALSYQVAPLVRQGALEVIMPSFEPAPFPIQFVHPSSRLLSAKVRSLIDLTLQTSRWDFTSI